MHDNVIIGLSILTAFTLSIMLALYGMRLLDRDRQWRPRRYGISAREVPCSFCGNLIRSEAILCRHCHHRLDEIPDKQAMAEARQDGEVDPMGVIQSPDRRLAPVAATYEIGGDDISKNPSFVWLDSAFAQLAVKPPAATWGSAMSDRVLGQNSDSPTPQDTVRKNEVMLRPTGTVIEQPASRSQGGKTWFLGLTPNKEWAAVTAGLTALALIVGGSTFFGGTSKSKLEVASDDYVTFDVSERAPLYTGAHTAAQAKAELAAQPAAVSKPVLVKPMAPTPVEPVGIAKPEAVVAMVPEPTVTPAVPMTALPTLPPMPAEARAAADMAAITPSPSVAESAPEPVAAPRREEGWASTVARAVKPDVSRDLVVVVQRLIRAEGYDPGLIDGVVGPRTRQAIRQYQRNGGLPQSGEIDRDLLKKLNLEDRTVRVIGPLQGIASVTRPRSTAKPPTEWTK